MRRLSIPRTTLTLGLCFVLALALTASPAAAQKKEKKKKAKPIAAYSGHTINTSPGSVRGTNFVTLEIQRWSTEEERQALATTLANQGSEAMVKSMQDSKERVGWVRLPGTTSYDLKYAREIQTDDGVQIVLATDRPVGFGELRNNARTLDYGVTILQFVMPADGKAGEGTIIVGAELELTESGQLNITTAGMNPVRFNNIKRSK